MQTKMYASQFQFMYFSGFHRSDYVNLPCLALDLQTMIWIWMLSTMQTTQCTWTFGLLCFCAAWVGLIHTSVQCHVSPSNPLRKAIWERSPLTVSVSVQHSIWWWSGRSQQVAAPTHYKYTTPSCTFGQITSLTPTWITPSHLVAVHAPQLASLLAPIHINYFANYRPALM